MPTTPQHTFTNQKLEPVIYPDLARTIAVLLGASLNLPQGQVLGQKTSDGKYYAYNDALSDGTQVAKAILPYAVQTDASGNVTFSGTSGQVGGMQGEQTKSCPVYISGYFDTADLTGLDANGVTDLGRLVQGTTSAGILAVR